jgi:hypothetical protein
MKKENIELLKDYVNTEDFETLICFTNSSPSTNRKDILDKLVNTKFGDKLAEKHMEEIKRKFYFFANDKEISDYRKLKEDYLETTIIMSKIRKIRELGSGVLEEIIF